MRHLSLAWLVGTFLMTGSQRGFTQGKGKTATTQAAASDRMEKLRGEAMSKLAMGEYFAASDAFEELIRISNSPDDRAHLAQCLNQLRQYQRALEVLDQQNGAPSPNRWMEREKAIALAHTENTKTAYEIMPPLDPADGRGAYYRGYLALAAMDWEEAARAFEIASRSTRFGKMPARLAATLKQFLATERNPDRFALLAAIQFRGANILMPGIARKAALQKRVNKRWRGFISVSGDYNSNVLAVPDAQPLPANIANEADASVSYQLGGGYDFHRSDRWHVAGDLGYFHRIHDDLSEFDYQRLQPKVTAERIFEDWAWTTELDLNFDWLASDDFLRSYGLGQHLDRRDDRGGLTRFGYRFAYRDFLNPPLATSENRSGDYHQLSAAYSFPIQKTLSILTLGGRLEYQGTDGSSFEAVNFGIDLSVRQALPYQFILDGRFSYDHRDHLKSNFRSPGMERRDRAVSAGVHLSRPVFKNTTAFIGYSHVDNDSNINAVFDYRQDIFYGGIRLRF